MLVCREEEDEEEEEEEEEKRRRRKRRRGGTDRQTDRKLASQASQRHSDKDTYI